MFFGAGVVLGLTCATLISVLRDSESFDIVVVVVGEGDAVYEAVVLYPQGRCVYGAVNCNVCMSLASVQCRAQLEDGREVNRRGMSCRAGDIPGHKRVTTEVGLHGLSIVRLVVSKPSGQEI